MADKPDKAASEAAKLLGRKGGTRTAELYGSEHFAEINKKRKTFAGGRPKKATTKKTAKGGK